MGQSWSIILNCHDSSGTPSDGGDASASAGRCWTASQRPGGGDAWWLGWPEGRYDPWMPQNHGEHIGDLRSQNTNETRDWIRGGSADQLHNKRGDDMWYSVGLWLRTFFSTRLGPGPYPVAWWRSSRGSRPTSFLCGLLDSNIFKPSNKYGFLILDDTQYGCF